MNNFGTSGWRHAALRVLESCILFYMILISNGLIDWEIVEKSVRI
jgi:hypothetical protein